MHNTSIKPMHNPIEPQTPSDTYVLFLPKRNPSLKSA